MGIFSRKSESNPPTPSTPIQILWSFKGSNNETVDNFGVDNPDSLNEGDMARLVAERHSLNWGHGDRARDITIKGWRKR